MNLLGDRVRWCGEQWWLPVQTEIAGGDTTPFARVSVMWGHVSDLVRRTVYVPLGDTLEELAP